jgi:indolepyruvate ferredoxin oxidoreductase
MGDSIATNLFMVGYAYQRGLIPVGEAAILKGDRAERRRRRIEQAELLLGPPCRGRAGARRRRRDPAADKPESQRLSESLDEMIDRRVEVPDRVPGRRLREALRRLRRERAQGRRARQPGATELTEAVARYYFKLLAIKDEYEVARLYAETRLHGARREAVRRRLQARRSISPRPSSTSRTPGRRGAQIDVRTVDDVAFRVLAKARRFRGGAFDLFGRSAERKMERALDRRVRDGDGRDPRQADAAELRGGRRSRLGARAHPRLRPREGAAREDAKVREAALLEQFRGARAVPPQAAPVR